MTGDDIIKMAREAGFQISDVFGPHAGPAPIEPQLTRFAALVAAAEREACAQVCDAQRDLREEARATLRASVALSDGDEDTVLRALRHESNVRLYHAGIDKCTDVIRARSQA